jgi:hypothetical protein
MDIPTEVYVGTAPIASDILQIHGNAETINRRIRTDGKGSLVAESPDCRKLFLLLGYTIQKTATDSSSQNGSAERPHPPLAAIVRYLLYSLSLPITFWADALVYGNYVNNRLYHSGVNGIPYTLWTGKRANLKHLRTFGAHMTVRRSETGQPKRIHISMMFVSSDLVQRNVTSVIFIRGTNVQFFI